MNGTGYEFAHTQALNSVLIHSYTLRDCLFSSFLKEYFSAGASSGRDNGQSQLTRGHTNLSYLYSNDFGGFFSRSCQRATVFEGCILADITVVING